MAENNSKTFIIDPETMRMLQEMAKEDMRTQSAQLRFLVKSAYDERNTLAKQLFKAMDATPEAEDGDQR